MSEIDPSFQQLPATTLADAALSRARQLGATHADFRLERILVSRLQLRDAKLDSSVESQDLGIAVRVVHDGAWGFASGIDRTPEAAARLADQAVATAKVSRVLNSDPVELAPEPAHAGQTWISSYQLNPFDVPVADRIALLTDFSERLLAADGVDHVDAQLLQVQENKYYADTAGTTTTQQRIRLEPEFTGVQVDSRRIVPGDLFVAVGNGVDFLEDAFANGAAATLLPDDAFAEELLEAEHAGCPRDSAIDFVAGNLSD